MSPRCDTAGCERDAVRAVDLYEDQHHRAGWQQVCEPCLAAVQLGTGYEVAVASTLEADQ